MDEDAAIFAAGRALPCAAQRDIEVSRERASDGYMTMPTVRELYDASHTITHYQRDDWGSFMTMAISFDTSYAFILYFIAATILLYFNASQY